VDGPVNKVLRELSSPRRTLGEPETLAEQAYVVLRDRLVTLAIPPGAPIHEPSLSRELDVGRTPLREAIKRLEFERLVVVHPRRGTFAAEVNIENLTDVADVRLLLEPHAARRAAEAASPSYHEQIAGAVATIRATLAKNPNDESLMSLDMLAHRVVYRGAANPYLEATLTQYHNLAIRVWCLFLHRLPDARRHVGQHIDLLSAVGAGEAALAGKLAGDHVRSFHEAILAVMKLVNAPTDEALSMKKRARISR
jgi:DNA-binding GntR family transcriptional regulator